MVGQSSNRENQKAEAAADRNPDDLLFVAAVDDPAADRNDVRRHSVVRGLQSVGLAGPAPPYGLVPEAVGPDGQTVAGRAPDGDYHLWPSLAVPDDRDGHHGGDRAGLDLDHHRGALRYHGPVRDQRLVDREAFLHEDPRFVRPACSVRRGGWAALGHALHDHHGAGYQPAGAHVDQHRAWVGQDGIAGQGARVCGWLHRVAQ